VGAPPTFYGPARIVNSHGIFEGQYRPRVRRADLICILGSPSIVKAALEAGSSGCIRGSQGPRHLLVRTSQDRPVTLRDNCYTRSARAESPRRPSQPQTVLTVLTQNSEGSSDPGRQCSGPRCRNGPQFATNDVRYCGASLRSGLLMRHEGKPARTSNGGAGCIRLWSVRSLHQSATQSSRLVPTGQRLDADRPETRTRNDSQKQFGWTDSGAGPVRLMREGRQLVDKASL
jgi:hypothetical protein